MRVLETIPSLDQKRLGDLETNARTWAASGTDRQKADAECVILAILAERQNRKNAADHERQRHAADVGARVRDKPLFDRVVMAFTEMPPEQWESEVLKEIAARPGRDFDTIAHAIGKKGGGYINLAVGTLCSNRQIYLGPAPDAKKKGEKVYSALLIDFTYHREPGGSEWHGWTLKPDAEAALRQLKIVG